MKRILFTASLLAGLISSPAFAADKTLVNLNKDGVALQGYDPVAFFTVKAPLKGKPEFSSTYHGAKYHFHSAKDKQAFDAEPSKYEPQFGGYCAFGVSKGKLVEIDVEAFQMVDGKLLLQYNKGVRDEFNKDVAGNLKKAEGNWSKLVEKKGQ